jgi:hypothetical protein
VTDFGDVDRVSQKLISANATIFLLAVYLLCAALDVINLLGAAADPQAVARFACSLRPFAIVALPDSLGRSAQFVADQCSGEVREPTISIIFLSIKLTMAVLAFIVLWGFVCWRPEGFRAVSDNYRQRFEEPGGYRKELKKFSINSLGILFFLFCCLLLASVGASERTLRFAVTLKIVVEDGLAVAIPAVALDVTAKAFLFFSLAGANRNSGLKQDN